MSSGIAGNPIEFARVAECELLFAKLALLKVGQIEVEFDGSGDSGSINSIACLDDAGNSVDVTTTCIDWNVTHDVFKQETGKWEPKVQIEHLSLDKVLEQICDEALNQSQLDWYNNDGGYGTLRILITANPPTAALEMHLRITNTDDYTFELTGLFKEPEDASKPPRANKRERIRR